MSIFDETARKFVDIPLCPSRCRSSLASASIFCTEYASAGCLPCGGDLSDSDYPFSLVGFLGGQRIRNAVLTEGSNYLISIATFLSDAALDHALGDRPTGLGVPNVAAAPVEAHIRLRVQEGATQAQRTGFNTCAIARGCVVEGLSYAADPTFIATFQANLYDGCRFGMCREIMNLYTSESQFLQDLLQWFTENPL